MKLLETICWRDDHLENIRWHNARLNQARREIWSSSDEWNLSDLLRPPPALQRGKYKVRVIYDASSWEAEWSPYRMRPVRSLRLMPAAGLRYEKKYADRRALDALFRQRGDCDDILMIRNGLLTDSYYANLALWDGDRWWTPARPLLPGVRRAQLLAEGMLHPMAVAVEDLHHFIEIRLINAMLNLAEAPRIAMENVR